MKWLWRGLALLIVVVAATFLVLRVPDTDPAAMRAKYGGPPSQFVELANGSTVHLRDEGPRDAPAIVLLHGSNADLHTWQSWAEDLRGDYRVIRFDQRGHGLTGLGGRWRLRGAKPSSPMSSGSTEALGLERFVLAGNSMGGAVAMGYAHGPSRTAGLGWCWSMPAGFRWTTATRGRRPGRTTKKPAAISLFTLARLPGRRTRW
jgi:hypothetical protein